METQDLLVNARQKMIRKNMDMIVANNLRDEGAGFEGDTNIITILDRLGHTVALDKMTKQEAAHRILDHIRSFKEKKGPAGKK
jgi:phosphopantothenoylcysteine decarboxylase/phosphopantothenate--cysteine ligase